MAGGALALTGTGVVTASVVRANAMADYDAAATAMRAPLPTNPSHLDLVRYATLAANGHNTQPWRFDVATGRIAIQPDLARRTPVVDPDGHHLFASLGCAAENLSLAAAAGGFGGGVRFDATGHGAVHVELDAAPAASSPLFDAIPRRQSTRAIYDGRPVGSGDLDALSAAARLPGVDIAILTDARAIAGVADLVVAGNTAQMADRAFVRELASWIRFNGRHALASGDGLLSAASGAPTVPTWLGKLMFERAFSVDAENDKYARQLASSSGVAVFVSEHETPEGWVQAGRACQRFALQATALGLKTAFINQPVEVPALRPELASLIGMPGRRPDIVVRFGHGPSLPFAPRRPATAVV